jgi:hypothetical protein
MVGLSACRSAPDVAAYLDRGNITTAEVQRVYNDAKAQASAAPTPAPEAADPTAEPARFPLTQDAVLDTLISHDVLARLAQKHNVTLPPLTPQTLSAYAGLLHLPAGSEFVRLYTEVDGYQVVLNQGVTGGTPSDADLAQVFQRLKEKQLVDPSSTAQQFVSGLSADAKKVLGTAITLKNEARDDLAAQHVRLNPRFGNFEIPIYTQRDQQTGEGLVLVGQPVGDPGTQVPVSEAP